jgi:hypothetical protein
MRCGKIWGQGHYPRLFLHLNQVITLLV